MFHEVLAALSGCPGSLFVYSEDQSTFEVLKGLEFLHPGEEVLLDRLCQLGGQFRILHNFAEQYLFNKENEASQGLYIRAFKGGINVALQPYQTELLEFQLDVLKDPHITLTHFLQLEHYSPLFRHLLEIVEVIKKDKIHGCKILEVIYNASNCGVPMVETCMKRILKLCHNILMKQIRDWVVFGTLNDPFQEFFLEVNTTNPKNGKYELRHELIPSYIPTAIVEKILFVGQSMEILGAEKYTSYFTLQGSSDFEKHESNFTQKLLNLANSEEFSLFQFASVITELRSCAAEQMWKVIVKDSCLLTHLQNVRDFFLLGNGEFFLAFIEKSNEFLKLPMAETTLKEAQMAFHSTLIISPEMENVAEKFHIVLLNENTDCPGTDAVHQANSAAKKSAWSSIGLTYDIPPSLDSVFTASLMERYNQLFRFLIAIRRVQVELYQCFVLQKCSRRLKHDSALTLFWQLRTHMSFFIDNLLYYLQVDIVESQFQELIREIEGVKDFEVIQRAHEQFLTSLASQCFLNLKSVYYCLMDILELTSAFCALLIRVHVSVGDSEMAHYANFRLNFQRQTSLLFRVLCGIRSHQDSPHLAQLMLRMDFNRYVTICGGHLGGPQEPSNYA